MSDKPPTPDDPDSEDRYRLAFEVTGDGFWDWDRVGDRWHFSAGLCTMLGRAQSELTHSLDSLTSLLHPDDREATLVQLRRCAEGECPSFQRELRLQCRDGEWLWVRCRCQGVGKGPTGGAARVIGVHSDISDRRRTEQAYQASEARYRMLVESQGEGIGIVDENEVFTTVNPAAEWIFGLEPGAMVGKSLADFVDQEQLERVSDQTERRRQGSRDTYELEFRRADGELRIMLVTATPRYDEDGGYLGAFGVFRDITDRKRVEDKLREEEERYRQLVESLPHGVALLQRDTTIFANQTATGLREGKPGGAVHYQTTAQHVSGKEVPVEAFVTSLIYRGERALQLVMMDISERLEAEAHRAKLENQLRQAQRLESIGRLAGGIAHDFNNLLSPIMLYSDMALQDMEPGDTHQEDFEQIRHAVRQARRLTQQLLAFGRRQVLKMKVLSMNDVVTEAHRLIRRLIREDIEIQLDLAPAVGNVKADPSQLQQVVMNLAINARDAMTEGGTMTIRSGDIELDETTCSDHTNLAPGPYVSLEVADTGRGLTPETTAQIFEPF
ncbi:MAG: PAS domain S-box protein, partial [Deltaproteobacteria bacterium]|nr:PAS domain S-box protein [Deltaproteobacteria bacterium]